VLILGGYIIDVNLDEIDQYGGTAMGWLTAAQALQMLRVRPQTLYANVSRKRIREKPDPKDPRRSLYHETDIRRLAGRHRGRRKSTAVAAAAIEWGDPILSSAVSTVAEGRLFYRGQDAVALAKTGMLEEIACLLWGVGALEWSSAPEAAESPPGGSPLERAFVALARRASSDPPSYGRTPAALQAEAASVVETLTRAMLGSASRKDGAIHQQIASAWGRTEAADVVRRGLVLLADHELNASTFATRVAISTGAPLAAGVLSGLATLSGPLHGRAALGVQEIMASVRRVGAGHTVREWLAQGRPIAGFGHPLYPAGDPRATALLAHVAPGRDYVELSQAVEEVIGEKPNIDFALAVLTNVYRLPADAPLVLFAVGRCVGWLAHAIEQAATGHPIRPRARYIGPPPVS
jgi:citrate synthase